MVNLNAKLVIFISLIQNYIIRSMRWLTLKIKAHSPLRRLHSPYMEAFLHKWFSLFISLFLWWQHFFPYLIGFNPFINHLRFKVGVFVNPHQALHYLHSPRFLMVFKFQATSSSIAKCVKYIRKPCKWVWNIISCYASCFLRP